MLARNEKCRGCASLFKKDLGHIEECALTPAGVQSIPGCICYDCLIKPVCQIMCEEFIAMISRTPSNV
jgi:hypothetical protein